MVLIYWKVTLLHSKVQCMGRQHIHVQIHIAQAPPSRAHSHPDETDLNQPPERPLWLIFTWVGIIYIHLRMVEILGVLLQ